MSTAQYRTQDVAPTPRGWRVRTVTSGEHQVRIAFPPGARRRGAGKVVQILHPRANPSCECGSCAAHANPAELVILGNPSRKHGRRNPPNGEIAETDQAVRLYQEFHGADPREILEVQRSTAMRLDYVCLGKLLGLAPYVEDLKIPAPEHWDDGGYPVLQFDGVKLASNAAGTQLYALDGDQDLSSVLDQFDVDPSKDLLDLGELAYVTYEARKSLNNFDLIEYTHVFDEPRPLLGFDQVKKEIFFVGGRYVVKAPGIEN